MKRIDRESSRGEGMEAFENRHNLAGNSNPADKEYKVKLINLISMFILNPFPWVQDPFSPNKTNHPALTDGRQTAKELKRRKLFTSTQR